MAGVLLLDNAGYPTGVVSNDASISEGVIHYCSKNSNRSLVIAVICQHIF